MEEKTKVLKMLSDGKIDVAQADKLLKALSEPKKETSKKELKFLNILVDSKKDEGKRVKIKLPLRLLKAGMKLTKLIPENSRKKIQTTMYEKGINFDLNEINSENIDMLLESLQDLEVSVDDDETVRIFCE